MIKILYQIPDWIQALYRGVTWRGDTSRKVVYLTFDDGPIQHVTSQVLDILKRENVHATFFMVGHNMVKFPGVAKRVRQEGHQIGNHTYNHLKGRRYKVADYMANVHKADELMNGTRLFRPPYGSFSPSLKHALMREGYQIILWDVLTHDYNRTYSPDKMLRVVKKYVRNGSIINFHDSLKSNERLIKALPMVIQFLKSEGYEFDTL